MCFRRAPSRGLCVKFLLIALLAAFASPSHAVGQQQAADTGLHETVLDFVVNTDPNTQ